MAQNGLQKKRTVWFALHMKNHTRKRSHRPWRIAHRGARDEAPENTRSAFERALAYPIDGIELDVQMSADGVPVLYHDRTLKRVGGGRKRVAELTYDALNDLDWGGWFHPKFVGEPLMTLEQVVTQLHQCPRWLIEIKSHPPDQVSGHAYRLTETAISIITRHNSRSLENRVYILSFDPHILATAHKLAPGLRYVLNLSDNDLLTALDPPPRLVRHLWAICLKINRLSSQKVTWARAHGLEVWTYTCNGPRQVNKALKLDADAILSDHPKWFTEYLNRLTIHQ